jgi:hypothetical protein
MGHEKGPGRFFRSYALFGNGHNTYSNDGKGGHEYLTSDRAPRPVQGKPEIKTRNDIQIVFSDSRKKGKLPDTKEEVAQLFHMNFYHVRPVVIVAAEVQALDRSSLGFYSISGELAGVLDKLGGRGFVPDSNQCGKKNGRGIVFPGLNSTIEQGFVFTLGNMHVEKGDGFLRGDKTKKSKVYADFTLAAAGRTIGSWEVTSIQVSPKPAVPQKDPLTRLYEAINKQVQEIYPTIEGLIGNAKVFVGLKIEEIPMGWGPD